MNDTFLPKREERKVNPLHPYISMYFPRNVLDKFRTCHFEENVVKNQELFQVCDYVF